MLELINSSLKKKTIKDNLIRKDYFYQKGYFLIKGVFRPSNGL